MPQEDHTYAKKKVSVIENIFEMFPLVGLEILDILDEQSKYNLKMSARSLKLHKIYCYLKINETFYQDEEILDVLGGQSKFNLKMSVKSLKMHNIYGLLKINETFYQDEKKWTPLHFAAKSDNLELFMYVFDRAPHKNPYDKDRNTPLHLAVQTLNPKICKHMIERIYNIHPKNNCGQTPLDLIQPAHRYEQQEIVKLFIQKHFYLKNRNPSDKNGITPLHHAAQYGHTALFRYIFDRATEKNPFDCNWTTPLHLAAGNSNPIICEYIIDHCNVYLHPVNKDGNTPLDLIQNTDAEIFYKRWIIRRIMSKHFNMTDQNPLDENGRTPLHYAAQEGHFGLFRYIFDLATEKNPPDNKKDTPLHLAARARRTEIAIYIIERIDQVYVENNLNESPLDLALKNGNQLIMTCYMRKSQSQ